MLNDLAKANANIMRFKRGLSVFEDKTLRNTLTTQTTAPLLQDRSLSLDLQKVLFSGKNLGIGP